jgi:hypothetical protein
LGVRKGLKTKANAATTAKAIDQVVTSFGLHSGLRQGGSAFGASSFAGLKPSASAWNVSALVMGRTDNCKSKSKGDVWVRKVYRFPTIARSGGLRMGHPWVWGWVEENRQQQGLKTKAKCGGLSTAAAKCAASGRDDGI